MQNANIGAGASNKWLRNLGIWCQNSLNKFTDSYEILSEHTKGSGDPSFGCIDRKYCSDELSAVSV